MKWSHQLKDGVVNLLLFIISPVLFFGGVELLLALWGERPILESKRINIFAPATMAFNSCESSVHGLEYCFYEEPKKGGVEVVVPFFGGSSVNGWPTGEDKSFVRWTEKKLNEGNSHKVYKLPNFGASCKDSYYVKECVRRVLDGEEVDGIFIYSGHNDMINMGGLNPEWPLFVKENPWIARGMSFLNEESRFYSLAMRMIYGSDLANEHGQKQFVEKITTGEIRENKQKIGRHFEKNLLSIIRWAQEKKVKVTLSTVISNLSGVRVKDFLYSGVNKAVPLQALGLKEFERGNFDQSIKLMKRAKDIDPLSHRAPSLFNQIIRNLASQYEHVDLIDFEKIFLEKYHSEVLGCDFFVKSTSACDPMHLNQRAREIFGQLISEHMKRLYPISPSEGT